MTTERGTTVTFSVNHKYQFRGFNCSATAVNPLAGTGDGEAPAVAATTKSPGIETQICDDVNRQKGKGLDFRRVIAQFFIAWLVLAVLLLTEKM